MSTARGQRWGGGKRARRRGRLLESIGGTVPWSAPEQLGVRGARSLAHPPRPNPFSEGEGPEIPGPVYRDSGGAAAAPQVAAWEQRLQTLPRRVRRALQRHFLLSLAELALVLALWQGPAWTAEIPVDGTTCTLAAAITAANTDAASGGCPAGSGVDTLVLPAGGTITLTAVDNTTTDGPNGLPVVTSTITIAGHGSTLQRGVRRLFGCWRWGAAVTSPCRPSP